MFEGREVVTELYIEAPASSVWEVLTNFDAYPSWNPMMRRVRGELREGAKLALSFQAGGRTVNVRAKLLEVEAPRALRWGGGPSKRLLWIEHYFRIEPEEAGVRFVHGERFDGLLGASALRLLGKNPRRRYEKVNEALRERVESQR